MLEHEACEQWVERLSAYADGEVDDAEGREVRAHVHECPACRAWVEQARADRSLFEGALTGQKPRWGFARGVMKQVAAKPVHGAAERRARGRRMTLVELVTVLVIVGVLAAILFPVFAKAREDARSVSCLSNIKQLCLALQMYAEDNHDYLPPLVGWEKAILPYVRNEELFVCPNDRGSRPGYALNRRVAGRNTKDFGRPESVVLLFDARDGELGERHNDGANYGFLDWHAKFHQDPPPGFLEDLQSLGPPTRNYGLAERLRIAYEAEQDVAVDDVPTAVMQAEHEIAQREGFLLNSDVTTNSDQTTAQIVFRVPAEALLETMNALARLGAVVNRHVTGEDLTEKYVAADRAVQSAGQEQERLQNIERRTPQMPEKLAIAEKVTAVHAAAEQQRSEVRQVLARTVLATGTARFFERERAAPWSLLAAAERAFRSSGRTGRLVMSGALWLLAYVPFWGGALAAFLVGQRWLRRRRS